MADLPGLSYYEGPPVRRRRPFLPLGVALVVIPALLYLLFELQRLPYRPPEDMTTALTRQNILAVRAVMTVLGVTWLACAGLLLRAIRTVGWAPPTTHCATGSRGGQSPPYTGAPRAIAAGEGEAPAEPR